MFCTTTETHWVERAACCALAVLLLCPTSTYANGNKKKQQQGRQFKEALQQMRQAPALPVLSAGSLWASQGHFASLAIDSKARYVNDLITIHVVEQTEAEGEGSLQSRRSLEASSSITNLLGPVGTRSLRNLFSPQADSSLIGQVQTSSNITLRTSLMGRVVEVLPNGYLVVEAIRMINATKERQTIIVRGIVRPEDILPDNSVLSTQIANLEVELKGKGVITNGTRRPNRVVRALLRILGL